MCVLVSVHLFVLHIICLVNMFSLILKYTSVYMTCTLCVVYFKSICTNMIFQLQSMTDPLMDDVEKERLMRYV